MLSYCDSVYFGTEVCRYVTRNPQYLLTWKNDKQNGRENQLSLYLSQRGSHNRIKLPTTGTLVALHSIATLMRSGIRVTNGLAFRFPTLLKVVQTFPSGGVRGKTCWILRTETFESFKIGLKDFVSVTDVFLLQGVAKKLNT